jgi:hypothetical protein
MESDNRQTPGNEKIKNIPGDSFILAGISGG